MAERLPCTVLKHRPDECDARSGPLPPRLPTSQRRPGPSRAPRAHRRGARGAACGRHGGHRRVVRGATGTPRGTRARASGQLPRWPRAARPPGRRRARRRHGDERRQPGCGRRRGGGTRAISSPRWTPPWKGGRRTCCWCPPGLTRSTATHSAASRSSPRISPAGPRCCVSASLRRRWWACSKAAIGSISSRRVRAPMCARLPETGRVRQRHRRCRPDADAGVAERRYTSAVTETVVQPQISKHWPASIYRRPDGVVEQALSPARMRGIVQSCEGELWVDINSMDMHQHALLEKVFEFHPLAVEDTLSPRTRVKLEEYDRYVFVVMAGIRLESTTPDPYDLETFNLYYFLGKNFLVTVHAVTALGCEAVRERLQRSADLLARGAEATMHAIIDQAVDAYFPLVEQINAHVDRLEERLFEEFDEGLI